MIEKGLIGVRCEHPGFAAYLGSVEDENGFGLMWDAPLGVELSRVITQLHRRDELLPFELIAYVVRELADAAAFAHRELSLVLRDILPGNVLLARDGRVLILTHRLELGSPERGASELPHLAPECLALEDYGVASDIYALGVLLFTLLAQKVPARGIVPVAELEGDGAPEPLVAIVSRATHPAKAKRYHSATELVADLDAWLIARETKVTPSVMASFVARHRLVTTLTPPPMAAIDEDTTSSMRLVLAPPAEDSTTVIAPPPAQHWWWGLLFVLALAGICAGSILLLP